VLHLFSKGYTVRGAADAVQCTHFWACWE